MSTTYTTLEDFITENIAPGLGDITLTDEQTHAIAAEVTEWKEGYLVQRTDVDFWEVVQDVLEGWTWDIHEVTESTHKIIATDPDDSQIQLNGDNLAEMLVDLLKFLNDPTTYPGGAGGWVVDRITWEGANCLIIIEDIGQAEEGTTLVRASLKI